MSYSWTQNHGSRSFESGATVAERIEFYSCPEALTGCYLWHGTLDRHGYGYLRLGHKNIKAHRIVWELTNGEILKGLCVCHRCDNRACVNIDHLWIGTNKDNTADKMAKGRANFATGGDLPQAKLQPEDIRAIRSDLRSNRLLGLAYGVSASLISNIKNRKIWKHVP